MAVIEPTQERRTVPSSAYRLHPNFNSNTLANDIGILIMPTDVNETPYIRYSRLPHDFASELFTGEMVTVVGEKVVPDLKLS
jgi:Trypsin